MKVQRYTWEDALIQAQTEGRIPNGALLLALKLAKAINWAPKGKKPAGLYWANQEALKNVGASRATYFKHREVLFKEGFFIDVKNNLIPQIPESLVETEESLVETEESLVETEESLGDNPFSDNTFSDDVFSEELLSVDAGASTTEQGETEEQFASLTRPAGGDTPNSSLVKNNDYPSLVNYEEDPFVVLEGDGVDHEFSEETDFSEEDPGETERFVDYEYPEDYEVEEVPEVLEKPQPTKTAGGVSRYNKSKSFTDKAKRNQSDKESLADTMLTRCNWSALARGLYNDPTFALDKKDSIERAAYAIFKSQPETRVVPADLVTW